MYWQEWELFVLHYEAFRTNLAIRMGIKRMTLRDIYPGACGEEYYKDLYVNLKRLSICEANEQFPNKELTDKYNNKIDLESGSQWCICQIRRYNLSQEEWYKISIYDSVQMGQLFKRND